MKRDIEKEADEFFATVPCKTAKISNSAAMPCSKDFEQLYYDLIYCVCNKVPGETRHETAKRILTQREHQEHGPAKSL